MHTGEWLCKVCDTRFDRKFPKGTHKVEKNICGKCLQWHHWCTRCSTAKLRSEFHVSTKSVHGLQSTCATCCAQKRKGVQVFDCNNCDGSFVGSSDILSAVQLHGWMCDDCRLVVKFCTSCKVVKPIDGFSRARGKGSGRASHCRSCTSKKWKTKSLEQRRDARLQKDYGITHADYVAMLEAAGNVCTICRKPETMKTRYGKPKPLHIDHCHRTGKVRGILCGSCNTALGYMQDDPERLRAAAQYLERAAAADEGVA